MFDSNSVEKTDKRQALLEVAEKLFAQQGFEAVSVRQLAKAAGANIAMVSYYFGSKEGLFKELVASRIPRTRGVLESLAADATLSAWDKVSATIDLYAEKFFGGRAFHSVIMREISLDQRPELVQIITDSMSKNMMLIRGFIHEGQEKGLFREVDPEFTIIMLFGVLSSYVNNSALTCKMLKEAKEESIFSEAHKTRLVNQVKSMLHCYLMQDPQSRQLQSETND